MKSWHAKTVCHHVPNCKSMQHPVALHLLVCLWRASTIECFLALILNLAILVVVDVKQFGSVLKKQTNKKTAGYINFWTQFYILPEYMLTLTDVLKWLMCFNVVFLSFQIQAEVSQRVQRKIPITLQICDPCRKPCLVFPLHRGRSATNTLPLTLQVQVRIKIPLPFALSLPILGWTQVRGALDNLPSPSSASLVKKNLFVLTWM